MQGLYIGPKNISPPPKKKETWKEYFFHSHVLVIYIYVYPSRTHFA
jgi:hypothetical protein